MGIVPRFETTCAAVYGRFTLAKRGLCNARNVQKARWRRLYATTYLPPLLDRGHLSLERSFLLVGHDGEVRRNKGRAESTDGFCLSSRFGQGM